MKLDLGCGNKKKDGFTGVDIIALSGVDVVCDLEKFPWPFEDNSVDEIHCSHYVEHTQDLVKFMDEVWRIAKPGAKITIVAPYYSSILAAQDPTHRRPISAETFFYFSKKWREDYTIGYYPINANFEIVQIGVVYNQEWINKPEAERVFAQKHYLNVIDHIAAELKAKKLPRNSWRKFPPRHISS
jgi:ubiquinone/menaquinone biosynthesis C-methylase UbiE